MAVSASGSWSGQQRADIPQIRLIESASRNDWDVFAGNIMAGLQGLVVRGFDITNADLAIGQNAVNLTINTANSSLMHPLATASGTIFWVPSGANLFSFQPNAQLQGSFTANSINYVGVDLRRNTSGAYAQASVDTVKFLDVSDNDEIARQVPLQSFLDYVIVVTTEGFDALPSVAPICKITTNSSNVVTNIQDCRTTPFRLAQGGSFPNIASSYVWPQGRSENLTGSVFQGGDKAIGSYKDWQDAMMTRLWELGGGAYWYSPTADRNIRMTRAGTTFSDGEWFEWDGTNLHWRGLQMVFDNSGTSIYYNTITDQLTSQSGNYGTVATNLADGDCIYTDITRNSNATVVALKGQIATLGTPVTPGSRYILAWRIGTTVYTRDSGFPVGSTFNVATTTSLGIVKLLHASATPGSPTVLTDGSIGVVSTGVVGLNSASEAEADGIQRFTTGVMNIGTSTTTTAVVLCNNATSAGSLRLSAAGEMQIPLILSNTDPTLATNFSGAFYLRTNGLSTPNQRTQLCVRLAPTNEIVVIAESSAH